MSRGRAVFVLRASAALAALCTACSGTLPGQAPPPATPAPSAYPGRCTLLQIQVEDMPPANRDSSRAGLGNQAIVLVATYRPGDRVAGGPISFAFEVQREMADDLSTHLSQHPIVWCVPESTKGGATRYEVEVPVLKGNQPKPVTVPLEVEPQRP